MQLLLLMAAALGSPQGLPQGRIDATGSAPIVERVTLGEVQAAPATHLGRELRFALQFRGLVEDWNPYLSRFEPSRWLALEAWPDEAFTWDEPVFDAPVGRLFLRRGGGFEPLARRARPHQRFEVRARVREVFLGEPWIELLEMTPLEGEVGKGTILHITRAREFAHEGQFVLALDQYERARSAPLPPHALAALLDEIRATEGAKARAKAVGRQLPEGQGKR